MKRRLSRLGYREGHSSSRSLEKGLADLSAERS
jgi:hypothetical protein